ncbi:MAG: disulfide bond formation protein B [Patescibacteria group bacterium]
MLTLINRVLALSTFAAHIFLVVGWLYFLFNQNDSRVKKFLRDYGLLFAWLVALAATASSLFYSEFAGFVPCSLCWWQRIFIYPQAILLGLAWFKRDRQITIYSLTLATIGGLIALYHNYIYYGGTAVIPCGAGDLTTSCVKQFVFELNYITIPIMSLTSFLLVIFFLWVQVPKKNEG